MQPELIKHAIPLRIREEMESGRMHVMAVIRIPN